VIEAEGLSKQFNDFWAVKDISLNVAAGEVLALLGPNGAGKTTTVRMLTSVLLPTQGRARVAGFDVVKYPARVRAAVGVLTEQHGLYGRMRSEEYLDFYGQLYTMSQAARRERIQQLLEQFGLAEDRKRRIGEYSKGMRQKLALARALLHDPAVLLLDEPTSAMDPESARLVRDSLLALRSADRTIILCTHNLAEAEELANQIAIIRRGRIIVRGSAAALKDQLLGAAEYQVSFGSRLNGLAPSLPEGLAITHLDDTWLRYHTDQPEQVNPIVLQHLLHQGLPVIGLCEAPRSLEQVYLQAVNTPESEEQVHG